MPALRRPSLLPGDLQKLNEALHDLHLAAGWPSVREMESALDKRFSYPVIHDVFSKETPRAPRLDVLLAVVEYLASQVRKETVDRFDAMWRVTARAEVGGDNAGALEKPSSRADLQIRVKPEGAQLRSEAELPNESMTDLLYRLQRSIDATKGESFPSEDPYDREALSLIEAGKTNDEIISALGGHPKGRVTSSHCVPTYESGSE